jgi:uncharacterized phage protein (TIGR01671 family)
MFRLIKLEEENETKFSPWGFEVCAKNVIKIQKIMDIKKLTQERELKFRVWDKLRERFTTCESGYQGHYILSLKGEFHNLQNGSGGKEYIVQQYTGLKDKNGKEIYEGDIIQLEGSPISYSIEWDRYQWAINAHGALGYDPDWNIQPFNHCVYERASVVGNVFENPELLKQ